jgi:hypothetical protein
MDLNPDAVLWELPNRRLELDSSLAFADRNLAEIVAYWDCMRGDRAMPTLADLNPLDLVQHLGWIVLTDVSRAPMRFRYRLVGSEITRRLGRDSTGEYLDELYRAEQYEGLTTSMRWVVTHRRPMRAAGRLWVSPHEWLAFETVDVPLAADGMHINVILTRAAVAGAGAVP